MSEVEGYSEGFFGKSAIIKMEKIFMRICTLHKRRGSENFTAFIPYKYLRSYIIYEAMKVLS